MTDGGGNEKAPGRVAAVLLAAGVGARAGEDNKLLRLWRGKPLVCYAAEVIAAARRRGLVGSAVVVTGRDGDEVAALMPADFARAHNPDFARGMAGSLKCGVAAVSSPSGAVLVVLGDMPLVTVGDVAAVIGGLGRLDDDIVVPCYGGRRGNPVALRRRVFGRVMALDGDVGARALFGAARVGQVAAGTGVVFDVDTDADFGDE